MRRSVPAVLATALLASGPAVSMELADVPAPVVAVAQHVAPGVEWKTAQMDVENDTLRPVFEVQGMRDGKRVEVDVTPSGELREIETQIDAAELPAEVKRLVDAYLPGFQPTLIERSARPSGAQFFEMEGTHQGREIDVEVSAGGDTILIADDAAV